MAKYHGRKGRVYISTSAAGNAAPVGGLMEWSLDMPTDKVETTEFGDDNKTYVQGLKDLTGAMSGYWRDDVDTLFTAAESADGCKIYLYPSLDAPTKYWYGPAWVDASVQVGVTDAVKVSANFAANGAWGRK